MSKKMLDLLQMMLKHSSNHDISKHVRIDGSTDISIREQTCKDFNRDTSIFSCLLTTRVGGFGLNLTGADRAIILDPDWNPANDNQAVDRCYRIGQKRDVIVYRLVSIGGLEERIYRRQVYKKGINLQTLEREASNDDENQNDDQSGQKAFAKYFDDKDLFQLFEFDDNDQKCETLDLIREKDGFEYTKTPKNVSHMKYL